MREYERGRRGKKRYKIPEYLYPVCYKAPRGAERRAAGGKGGKFRQLSH